MTHISTSRDFPHNLRFRSKSAVELGDHEKTKDGISKKELDKIRSLSRQSWKCSWEDPGNPLPGVKSNHFVTTYSTTHNYKALRELTPCRPTSPTRRNNPHPTRFAKILFCLKGFVWIYIVVVHHTRGSTVFKILLTKYTKFESAWHTISTENYSRVILPSRVWWKTFWKPWHLFSNNSKKWSCVHWKLLNIIIVTLTSTWLTQDKFVLKGTTQLVGDTLLRQGCLFSVSVYFISNFLWLSRSFLRLHLRQAEGFPKAKEKPGQDPYDGILFLPAMSAMKLFSLRSVIACWGQHRDISETLSSAHCARDGVVNISDAFQKPGIQTSLYSIVKKSLLKTKNYCYFYCQFFSSWI